MSAEELRAIVEWMSTTALDLAQHLAFTNDMLAKEHRDAAYKRAEQWAYELTWLPYNGPGELAAGAGSGLAFFGEKGLEKP
jgi:hypothetical protein